MFQEKLHNFNSVLLAGNVKRCEAILLMRKDVLSGTNFAIAKVWYMGFSEAETFFSNTRTYKNLFQFG